MYKYIAPIETENFIVRFSETEHGIVTDLVKKPSQILMTDAPEIFDGYRELFEIAHGDVLIAGLGLGMCIVALEMNPNVRSITIIEKDDEILHLIAQSLMLKGKTIIMHANIFEYSTALKFDIIFFDIWLNPTKQGKAELEILRERFSNNLLCGGWMSCWRESEYARMSNVW